jgi:DNA-binding transcriptional ArsR family regulator
MANAAEAFTALGDPTRREIFERLAARPMPVGRWPSGCLSAGRPSRST